MFATVDLVERKEEGGSPSAAAIDQMPRSARLRGPTP